jgi:hypothetical protein
MINMKALHLYIQMSNILNFIRIGMKKVCPDNFFNYIRNKHGSLFLDNNGRRFLLINELLKFHLGNITVYTDWSAKNYYCTLK